MSVISTVQGIGLMVAMAGMLLAIYSAARKNKRWTNHPTGMGSWDPKIYQATRIPVTRRDQIVGVTLGLTMFVVGLLINVYIAYFVL